LTEVISVIVMALATFFALTLATTAALFAFAATAALLALLAAAT